MSRHPASSVTRKPVGQRYRPALETFEERLAPATVYWINPDGGDWAEPVNWSTGTLPGPEDDVIIDVPGDITVTHSTRADMVRSLTSAETLAISGGSLALATPSVVNAPLVMTGGTLTGAGTLSVMGEFAWSGGILTGAGTLVAAGGLLIHGTGSKVIDGRTVENAAAARWIGPGTLTARNGAQFHNRAAATMLVENDATFRITDPNDLSTFENAGTFLRSSAGTTTLELRFNNRGVVDLRTGTTVLWGAVR